MVKEIFMLGITALLAAGVFAAEPTPWEVNVNANLMGSFQYYTKNWTGEEKGAVAWTGQLNADLKRQFNSVLHNRNVMKLAFGQTNYQKESRDGFLDPVKSTDLVDLESILKFTPKIVLNPFIGVRYISQFLDESDSSETFYFNPSELTESFGGAFQVIKNDKVDFVTRLGGAVRQTFNRHEAIDNTNDGGVELVSELNATNKDGWIKYQSLLKIYEAIARNGDPEGDGWRHPDVNWENTLVVNLTKYLMLNVYTQLLYDKEIDLSVRFKNVTSIGVTFLFSNKKPETDKKTGAEKKN